MNVENLCQICREKSAPYKCPKCQLRYCSLNCYRDAFHDQCTKKFDEKEFFDSLPIDEDDEKNNNQTRTTSNDFVRTRIEEILKRKADEKEFHNEDDDEHMEDFFEQMLPSKDATDEMYREGPIDDEEEGEERLASDEEPLPDLPDDIDDESDENVNQLWSYLTNEEKKEFKTMLTDGRISHLLNDYKPWKPWWLYKTEAPSLITDLENPPPSSSSSTLPDTIPSTVSNIVPLPSLTSILPHVHVRFDLFEVLFAYALINIRYRGEFSSYLIESGNEFLHISSRHLTQRPELIIEEQDSISILQTRISLLREHLEEKTISLRLSEEFFVNLLADISMIVHGPYPRQTPSNIYVLAALSDLKQFVIKMQEYQPPTEELSKETPTVTNVFHQNRSVHPKVTVNRSNNSKLCIRPSSTASKSSDAKAVKKVRLFNRKSLQSVSRKIDYLLSWTITHFDRLRILEFELSQIEDDHRRQLDQYQRDKTRIEKNLDRLRLRQKNLVEEM